MQTIGRRGGAQVTIEAGGKETYRPRGVRATLRTTYTLTLRVRGDVIERDYAFGKTLAIEKARALLLRGLVHIASEARRDVDAALAEGAVLRADTAPLTLRASA